MKKDYTILVVEALWIATLIILLQTALFGGFSLKIGPISIRSHTFAAPAILLFCATLLRRFLTGTFFSPFLLGAVFQHAAQTILCHSHRLARQVLTSRRFRKRLGIALFTLVLLLVIVTVSQPLQRGMTASYYDNPAWEGKPWMFVQEPYQGAYRMQRVYPFADKEFSIDWQGVMYIPKGGEYDFTTVSSGGSELYLDDRLVVDNRGKHDYQERRGAILLEKGFHALRLKYAQYEDFAELKVFWSPPRTPTGQAGRRLADADLFLQTPSHVEFVVGNLLEIISTMLVLLFGGFALLLFLVAWLSRHLLFPSASNAFVIAALFLLVFSVHYFFSNVVTSFDSRWSIHTTLSMIKEGNTDLNEYSSILREHQFYAIERIDDRFYTKYPIGTSVLAAPFVYVIDMVMTGLSLDMQSYLNTTIPTGMEKFIASLLVAGCAALLFLVCELAGSPSPSSVFIVLVFAFGTSAWSTASRALWQHAPSLLMLLVALYLTLLAFRHPHSSGRLMQFTSLPLAFAYVIRPTNSIPVLVFSVYVLLKYRKQFLPYCLWSLPVAVPFLLYNFRIYGAILSPYYLTSDHFDDPKTPFFEALAGIFVSPSRGLLIFSPILIFAFYGIAVKMRQRQWNRVDTLVTSMLLLHTALLAVFPCWWGGHSYGPRLFSEMIPFFLYFLVPALEGIGRLKGLKRQSILFALSCAFALSCYMHFRGATTWAVYEWNVHPAPVDEKLWDWEHPQFMAK